VIGQGSLPDRSRMQWLTEPGIERLVMNRNAMEAM
jgi:hypothetical protein